MINKNDPLIGAVQQVMQRNQAERDAAKAVNEKFGIQDRKALPHQKQPEWDAAFAKVLNEGVEALDEISLPSVSYKKTNLGSDGAGGQATKTNMSATKSSNPLAPSQKTTTNVEIRKGATTKETIKNKETPDKITNHVTREYSSSHLKEDEQIDEVLDTPKGRESYAKKAGAQLTSGKNVGKRARGLISLGKKLVKKGVIKEGLKMGDYGHEKEKAKRKEVVQKFAKNIVDTMKKRREKVKEYGVDGERERAEKGERIDETSVLPKNLGPGSGQAGQHSVGNQTVRSKSPEEFRQQTSTYQGMSDAIKKPLDTSRPAAAAPAPKVATPIMDKAVAASKPPLPRNPANFPGDNNGKGPAKPPTNWPGGRPQAGTVAGAINKAGKIAPPGTANKSPMSGGSGDYRDAQKKPSGAQAATTTAPAPMSRSQQIGKAMRDHIAKGGKAGDTIDVGGQKIKVAFKDKAYQSRLVKRAKK